MAANVEQISGEIGTLLQGLVAWSVVALPHFVGAIVLLVAGWWLASRAERGTGRILDLTDTHRSYFAWRALLPGTLQYSCRRRGGGARPAWHPDH